MDMEQEIVGLRRELASKQGEHAQAKAEADAIVARIRESGANPLDKDNFATVDEAYKRADALADEVADVQTRVSRALQIVGEKADAGRDSSERREAQSMAEAFLRSAEYERLRTSGALGHSRSRIGTDPVEVATRDAFVDSLRLRTTVSNAAGSGGGLIWSDRLGLVVTDPQRKVRLLDVMTVGTTDSDTIEWSKETTHTDAAAETEFGTAVPEAAYGYTKQSTTVMRIGHWVPATRGALADAGQLRTLLQGNLEGGVKRRIELQALKGDGTGDNLVGLLDSSNGLTSQARGSDSYWDAVHKAITRIRVAAVTSDELEPQHILMHPADYETLVLAKDQDLNYLNRRGAEEVGTVWGLTPVVTTLATSGTVVVGDFSHQYVWMREGISVAASTEHSDFFLKGLVALLAETRAATACTQPKAFQVITSW